jgi:Oxidoreductase family, NAD-binding Rossmann fold
MTKVRVGLVGTGFVAELHMYAYKRVYGVDADVVAAVSRSDQVDTFAKKHKIAHTYRDYRALLADPAIDVVDICTPPALHAQMIVDAVRAGKHVICEKPFTGYFGRPGDPKPIGRKVPKAAMYEHVMAEMTDLRAAIENSGKLFMYAEDWVYAPALAKTVEILQRDRRQDPVHESRGEPQWLPRRARRALGDDRRRLADSHGMPSAGRGSSS